MGNSLSVGWGKRHFYPLFFPVNSGNDSKQDVTEDILKLLREKCPQVLDLDLIASANAFPPSDW